MRRRLLLLSNSRAPDGEYLRWALPEIRSFLGVSKALFVPYAGLPCTAGGYDAYAARVRAVFTEIGCGLHSIHEAGDPIAAIRDAEALVVGGGNTFLLLRELYAHRLVDVIAERVRDGLPYVGWSAGANVACRTICTTNDMPIVQPASFQALNLVPFQINPHYTDAHPAGHQGETRAQRIAEFQALNPGAMVIGLREGALLRCENDAVRLVGTGARVFRSRQGRFGCETSEEVAAGDFQ
jgi:dipeptidase E